MCIMPETKPDIQIFDDGVCDACKSFKNRKKLIGIYVKRNYLK